jgi:hypothetical protein
VACSRLCVERSLNVVWKPRKLEAWAGGVTPVREGNCNFALSITAPSFRLARPQEKLGLEEGNSEIREIP